MRLAIEYSYYSHQLGNSFVEFPVLEELKIWIIETMILIVEKFILRPTISYKVQK
jgi:hypothetical protein